MPVWSTASMTAWATPTATLQTDSTSSIARASPAQERTQAILVQPRGDGTNLIMMLLEDALLRSRNCQQRFALCRDGSASQARHRYYGGANRDRLLAAFQRPLLSFFHALGQDGDPCSFSSRRSPAPCGVPPTRAARGRYPRTTRRGKPRPDRVEEALFWIVTHDPLLLLNGPLRNDARGRGPGQRKHSKNGPVFSHRLATGTNFTPAGSQAAFFFAEKFSKMPCMAIDEFERPTDGPLRTGRRTLST